MTTRRASLKLGTSLGEERDIREGMTLRRLGCPSQLHFRNLKGRFTRFTIAKWMRQFSELIRAPTYFVCRVGSACSGATQGLSM